MKQAAIPVGVFMFQDLQPPLLATNSVFLLPRCLSSDSHFIIYVSAPFIWLHTTVSQGALPEERRTKGAKEQHFLIALI